MDEYIGLDVSLEETAISIRRDGQRIWRGKCKSDPNVISTLCASARLAQSAWCSKQVHCLSGFITR